MSKKKVWDIYGKKRIFFVIPIVIALAALVVALVAGIEVDIEFKGGTLVTYSYTGDLDTAALKSAAEKYGYGTVNVTTGTSFNSSTNNVTLSYSSNNVSGGAYSGIVMGVVSSKVAEINAVSDDYFDYMSVELMEKFSENDLEKLSSQNVSPTSGWRFFAKCLVAVIFSFILLVIYIAFRFKKIGGLSAGVFALVALIHDILIVFASFIFFRLPLDANFMAVVLTILGYSINNTIVTYDRIRENRTVYGKKMGLVELMNTSVSQTMTRSVNTTITTAFAALAICVVAMVCGVESIISFAFPLLIGLLAGFYSSVFMSGSMWVSWQLHKEKKAAAENK